MKIKSELFFKNELEVRAYEKTNKVTLKRSSIDHLEKSRLKKAKEMGITIVAELI